MRATLYTTSGCHLCEIALEYLNAIGVTVDAVEIADDTDLMERYGVTIPVVARTDGTELNWPFDIDALRHFLCNDTPPATTRDEIPAGDGGQ
jgi:glutaredoxin